MWHGSLPKCFGGSLHHDNEVVASWSPTVVSSRGSRVCWGCDSAGKCNGSLFGHVNVIDNRDKSQLQK